MMSEDNIDRTFLAQREKRLAQEAAREAGLTIEDIQSLDAFAQSIVGAYGPASDEKIAQSHPTLNALSFKDFAMVLLRARDSEDDYGLPISPEYARAVATKYLIHRRKLKQ